MVYSLEPVLQYWLSTYESNRSEVQGFSTCLQDQAAISELDGATGTDEKIEGLSDIVTLNGEPRTFEPFL